MSDKYHRTMREAFGPYTNDYIYEEDHTETLGFRVAVCVTILLAVLIVGLLVC